MTRAKKTTAKDEEAKKTETQAKTTSSSSTKKTTEKKEDIPCRSRKRLSIREFFIGKDVPRVHQAGFSATLEPNSFYFENEWQELFNEYMNR